MKKHRYLKSLLSCLGILSLIPIPGMAAESLGTIANNLLVPATGIAHMLNLASVICGTGFLLAAVLQYKNHRDNPQEVPLSRPVTYLILGLALVLLPYFTMISQGASFISSLF